MFLEQTDINQDNQRRRKLNALLSIDKIDTRRLLRERWLADIAASLGRGTELVRPTAVIQPTLNSIDQ